MLVFILFVLNQDYRMYEVRQMMHINTSNYVLWLMHVNIAKTVLSNFCDFFFDFSGKLLQNVPYEEYIITEM